MALGSRLSMHFPPVSSILSTREGKVKSADFSEGEIVKNHPQRNSSEKNGTQIIFEPDPTMFGKFNFIDEYVEAMLRNYTYLNTGLTIVYNGPEVHFEKRTP